VKRLRLTPEAELDLEAAFPLIDPVMRRALIRRFPYAIFYEVQPRQILVYGVFHGARDPRAWKRRRGA